VISDHKMYSLISMDKLKLDHYSHILMSILTTKKQLIMKLLY